MNNEMTPEQSKRIFLLKAQICLNLSNDTGSVFSRRFYEAVGLPVPPNATDYYQPGVNRRWWWKIPGLRPKPVEYKLV